METLKRYRAIIKNILTDYHGLMTRHPKPTTEAHLVLDEEHDQYVLLKTGWSRDRRIYTSFVHARLHGGKFWIEQDWTEEGIATDLLRAGVPREDIVLAFHPPEMRPLTEFAVA